jgi:hypothetical protein
VTLHAMGANAVVGLDDVLQAVSDKRVEALIISDGFRTTATSMSRRASSSPIWPAARWPRASWPRSMT